MRVKFKRKFFGPDGNRRRIGKEYVVPDSWAEPRKTADGKELKSILPPDTVIIEEPSPAAEVPVTQPLGEEDFSVEAAAAASEEKKSSSGLSI